MAILILALVILFILFIFASIAFWIWMLVDCVQKNFKKENDKVVWILVIILAGSIGATIYYFVEKRKS
jgi:hypothetical protein